ncbi:hypothetical protein PIB30_096495 [Stylosanthes scabra]|uniref:Uncharacterized protein n=1 Tax=Stylosanthes scabra TaxID=79078 RepID=A0ABU6UXT1_9FABA|nr:hypothetical protein [Stylosanthes scabra]
MPRMKRTARKQPMEDVVYEEPPQDHLLGKYFKTLDDLNGYILTFSDRKEIPPWIDLSKEVSKTLGNSGVINIRTLHHMGRAMEEEEAPQAHQAPQAPQATHEAQVGSSQQPSMLDLMHVLQRIEQNQDRMDRRFQRVDRRLHRIEQYLEIEKDEGEDQD